ncbi:MAG TPA: alpha/beta hydrolase [Rhodocyclaceae bacterium]|nr:alpha/beta hydrolase [Rhodocyclaceae bacterium]
MSKLRHAYLLSACAALILAGGVQAETTLRERVAQRLQEKQGELDTYRARSKPTQTIAYGQDPNQRFDVYIGAHSQNAPVIFMVHGGGWKRGDKAMSGVVDNKFERWGPRGIVFISTNYRMLPGTDPYAQAQDVARALAKAQAEAPRWGADPRRFVLMGHSAGAHLVALLAVSPEMQKKFGVIAPLATVSLDSGTLNTVDTMENRHFALHDAAFGKDRNFWIKTSPWHALSGKPAPLLAVCSTRRADACPQAQQLVDKIRGFGGNADVLREDLAHGEINKNLGLSGAYTEAVERFLSQTDPALAERLR